jgi:DNA-binding transcriptional regulator LsrR (DeoR family)
MGDLNSRVAFLQYRVYSDLEEALEARFKLKEAVVVDSQEEEERMVRDLGAAAAFFVETTVKKGMVIGISSWSRSLLAMVDVMNRTDCNKGGKVVQILGGVGTASTQYYATQAYTAPRGQYRGDSSFAAGPGAGGNSRGATGFEFRPGGAGGVRLL